MSDLRARLQKALGDAFALQRELGSGGESHAFLATEGESGRAVVLKVIPSGSDELFAERFAREAKFVARLQHDRIVPLLAAGNAGGVAYFSMPFVEGETLHDRLARGEPIAIDDATRILRDVATALDYAHEQGVVHRELKPERVILSSEGAVVTDFGIAKATTMSRTLELSTATPGGANTTLTSAGSSPRTPAYMAPEQATAGAVDRRADLYAWGVIAYELLTGHHPFAGKKTAAAMIAAHIAEAPTPILEADATLPPALAAAVMMCLEKDPDRRPVSASVLLEAIDGEMPGAPPAPREGAPSEAQPEPPIWARETPTSSEGVVVAPPRSNDGVNAAIVAIVAIVIVAALIWMLT